MSILDPLKLMLGTVQLGLDYGITNSEGKPSRTEALNILQSAWEKGIRAFDTAPGYKTEELLGDFIKAHGINEQIIISTKISSLTKSFNFKDQIKESIAKSLENLNTSLNFLLLHDVCDKNLLISDSKYFEQILNEFEVKNLGVSIYDIEDTQGLNELPFPVSLQFPFNILDRRFELLQKKEEFFLARSIFLQGILATKKINIASPPGLKDLSNSYHNFLDLLKLKPIPLALSSVFLNEKIDFFLLGVDSEDSLLEVLNSEIYNKEEIMKVDITDFKDYKAFLDPRNW